MAFVLEFRGMMGRRAGAAPAHQGRRDHARDTDGRAPRIPLVYIKSAPHSGSTLLALQLARHADVCTVGELSGTPHRARPGYRCSCGRALAQCSFWMEVSAAMATRGFSYAATTAKTDIRDAPSALVRRLMKPLHRGPLAEAARDAGIWLSGGLQHVRNSQALKAALAESVLQCSGKTVLVDSSKSGVQLKYHLRNPRFDVKVLWLVRDGRGTSLSLARNARLPLGQAAYQWRRSNEEAALIVRGLDRAQWMQVRYEDLCEAPDRTLSALWQFIGVWAHPAQSATRTERHVLGHRSRLHGGSGIRLDEKWRKQLSQADLQVFEEVAGRLNRELGYG
jgi:hypothetical protein